MKRRLPTFIAFLVLGMLMNVGLSWACVYWRVKGCPFAYRYGFDRIQTRIDEFPASVESELRQKEQPGLEIAQAPHAASSLPALVVMRCEGELVTNESGWPMRSMASRTYYGKHRFHVPLTIGGEERVSVTRGGMPLEGTDFFPYFEEAMLPLRPIWPGFAVNTVVYAGILWLLFPGPFALRRWRRIKRGLCPKCAYDLRGGNHIACPECGVRSADSRKPIEPSFMKRRLAKLGLFLLLGAIINVAVAWGCAIWMNQETYLDEKVIAAPQTWPRYIAGLGWPPPHSAVEVVGTGVGVTVVDLHGGDPEADFSGPNANKTFVSLQIRSFGLPSRSMRWESPGVRGGPQTNDLLKAAANAAGSHDGIDISQITGARRLGHARHLPLTMIWPGFAINTVFYAAILWGLFAVPGRLRRWRRTKRGLCPACAYPVGESRTCTECGHPVKR